MQNELMNSQLVEKTLEGDINAFAILVNKYRNLVYGLAYNFTGSFQDAEDIAQEAFIRAYDNLANLKDKARFGNWLRVITLNCCKMWPRESTKELLFEVSSPRSKDDDKDTKSVYENDINSSLVINTTPDEICINKEFQESVFTALSALHPKNQVVITLFYLYKTKDVHDILMGSGSP